MNLSIGKKIAFGFAIALLALLAVGRISYVNIAQVNLDALWVEHTLEVERDLQNLMGGLLQVESSSRAHTLVPFAGFMELNKNGRGQIITNLRALRDLTHDNASQQDRLDRLEPLITERLESLKRLLELQSTAPVEQRAPLITDGEQTMAQIRRLISDMVSEEERLLVLREANSRESVDFTFASIGLGTALAFLLVSIAGFVITRSITSPLRVLSDGATRLGEGRYEERVNIKSKDEVGHLASVFNRMAAQVEDRKAAQDEQDWLKTSLARFAMLFQGRRNPSFVCNSILAELAALLEARHSVLYTLSGDDPQATLRLQAAYAADGAPKEVAPGEGLVGQCFLDQKRIVLRDIPEDYLQVNSALGKAGPRVILLQPALFESRTKAVLELALLREPTDIELSFLDQLSSSIGIVLNTIEGAVRTEELLKQSQVLSEGLRSSEILLQEQQEELKQTNEELEQTNEEMQQTNEEMEEKVNLLAQQKGEVERANRDIEAARQEVEDKAEQVALASKYKSDFLSSMSHELRTPLNSLLILSKILSDNSESNLTEKQIKYAHTINSSGNDLLELINDILDLSKIESGAVEIELGETPLVEIKEFVESNFRHVAESRNLEFSVEIEENLPPQIETDSRRVEQILKNLLANAFKFTKNGSVKLQIGKATSGWSPQADQLNSAKSVLGFAVRDTGIGIPPEKQQLIFEAFQQADAGTARKYGGTGLGLSISRELAALLGGSLQVTSEAGKGSTFTLYLPAAFGSPRKAASKSKTPPQKRRGAGVQARVSSDAPIFTAAPSADNDGMEDDRTSLEPGAPTFLIIEDDRNFARILMDFAREKRFKVVVARSAEQGVAWARKARPSAISLDLHLPDNDGWVVLDQLKHDPETRHIPIHIISVDEERERSLRLGAVSYIQKPVTKEALENALTQTIDFMNRPIKNLLVIEDDSTQRQSIVELIGNGDVKSTAVGTATEAFAAMDATRFDCVVLDLGLPDQNGLELIREIHTRYGKNAPPVIVYTGKELSREEETELRMISESIVIKNVRSPERLLDETALFLHRVQAKLPEPKRRMIEEGQKSESVLTGRRVLVVDDDVRNIFAITSALEDAQMQVIYAESGAAGIAQLEAHPETEVVLMDVMMPEMDGFEAIRRIRKIDRFKKLPIISVTAKAMKGDREKCLEVGASDYITKPVDMDQLRSLLRVWLYRG